MAEQALSALPQPLISDLHFRQYIDENGEITIFLTTPWYGRILIAESFIHRIDHDKSKWIDFFSEGDGNARIRFSLSNGWAVYEFVERDAQKAIGVWRCIESWGQTRYRGQTNGH